MSLEDIIDELKAESPAHPLQEEPGYGPWGIMEGHDKWSAEDKAPGYINLPLSKYEAYWLWWRLRVHLKSYYMVEWSEMKEVLECLIQRISTLSTPKPLDEASSSTLAEVCSKESSIEDSASSQSLDSPPSPVPSVEPLPSGTMMEATQNKLETPLT